LPSIINASNSGFGGIVSTGDSSGELQFQTAGTTAVTIDTSQRVGFVAGTAAAPAITRTGDTNTGMFFPAADTIAFAEGGAESMRIDSSGNVGIGTASPSTKLDIYAATNGDLLTFSNSVGRNLIISSASDGTYNDALAVFNKNSSVGQFVFKIQGTERVRIDSSGSLLVGTATAISGFNMVLQHGNSGAGAGLATVTTTTDAVNAISFRNPNGQIGRVQVNLTTTTYVTSSDYRLKENIVPMTGALDKVSKLKPVTYTWKTDGTNGQGFIAHELQEFYPEAVAGTKDEVDAEGNPVHQGVDTSFLVATLTAAIQEQQTIINDLKARVTALEAK
jgi:hypothetical protein